jgi:chromosome segregation and condensation protein ScpB
MTSEKNCAAGAVRRKNFAEAIRVATSLPDKVQELSRAEAGVLTAIAYFKPVMWGEISENVRAAG